MKAEVTLVAYVRLHEGGADQSIVEVVDELKRHLVAALPAYMIPSHIVPVESFPLNKNGKLDRSKLPSVSTQNQDDAEQDTVDAIDSETPIVEVVMLVFATELMCDKETIWKERGKSFFEMGGTR